MIKRQIEYYLSIWKHSPSRQVLLVRGARQVGKTFSIRQFAKSFASFIEVNFLETPEVAKFFTSGSLAPDEIIEKLEIYYGVSIESGESLLFFDEIQECKEALIALRFFQEKYPSLHVIAAGSLLEFALSEIPSFGVGRVDSIFMYPLSFEEFLGALGQQKIASAIRSASPFKILDPTLHTKATGLLRIYTIVGGLPAIVHSYQQTKDINLCMSKIDSILLGYEDDFAKYKTRINPLKLRETLRAAAQQAGRKFVYSHINSTSSTTGYDQSLELLRLAGLIYKVQRSSANGIPLGGEIDQKSFKTLLFDIGVYHRLLGLTISKILVDDEISFVNRGALAEVLCGTELIVHSPPTSRAALYYWSREQRGSNAEVDYLIQQNNEILPIEVKAGTKGKMQSLYLFLSEKKKTRGVRCSMENFSHFTSPQESALVEVVPLYGIGAYASQKVSPEKLVID
jgi:predicted AAA+ superfamily ATPase